MTEGAEFGSRYKGPIPAAVGGTQLVLSNLDLGPPGPVIVHLFGGLESAGVVSSSNAGYRAKVTYGAGAVTNVLRCDWGGHFTLACSQITIELETFKFFEAVAYSVVAAADHMSFGAMLGIGGSASPTESIGYTEPNVVVGAASGGDGVGIATIPQFARRVFPSVVRATGVMLTTAELANLRLVLTSFAGTRLGVYQLTEARLLAGIPMLAHAHSVNVENANAFAVNLVCHFKLGL